MRLRAWLLPIVLCWSAAVSPAATIVYDNLTTPLGSVLGGFAYEEIADDVTLGPGPRLFASASVAYSGTDFTGDETLTLTLYQMDGAPTPGSFGFNTPGTVLFSQTVPIAETAGALAMFSDGTPSEVLPDFLGIGLIFGGVTGREGFGPLLYDPPSVGSSFDDFWLRGSPNPGAPWGLFTFGGEPPANLGLQIATVEPVPEPAALSLLGLGLLCLGVMRRKASERLWNKKS